jgi:glycerol-3-phosphate O-acyltransferase
MDPLTAMTPRFGRLARAFGERFFTEFRLEPEEARELRRIEALGAVVYVMRYSSRLDYFLFNWLFLREGLRLATFANGIRFYYYRPALEAVRALAAGLWLRLRGGREAFRAVGIRRTRAVLESGGTMFLFLRTDKIRSRLRTRRGAVRTAQSELDYLREVIGTCFERGSPVFLVPLALFWRKGLRTQRRFLNVFYGAPERPTDTGKVVSFLWNYRNLAVRVGTPIDLGGFVSERRSLGIERLARQVRRVLLIFLRREEKPVAGPALRPLPRVEERVLADPDVQEVIAETAAREGRSVERVDLRARRYFREIASNPSPTVLALLDSLVTWMFRRLFERLDVRGLERVEAAAKLHPLVLIPCHRSHFDYVILSWLFYERHLVPPLVAAGINLAFFPLGAILRRAGAFYLRRTFEGNRLYTVVFRSYVRQLIKDGVTQEFFIEGTRSRTGRTLEPRLGMLRMVLEAFARGVRRDVYIVPVGFTYERLVEEGSIIDERLGARKTRESLLALIRARRVLRRRHGTVIVRFGEPISLAQRLGRDRAVLGSRGPEQARVRREVTERFGLEICRELNALLAAGRTGLAAAALLPSTTRGVPRSRVAHAASELAALLRHMGAELGEVLEADLETDGLPATVALLEEAGLARRLPDRRGELLCLDERSRGILDYYRGALAPRLALAGTLALALRRPAPRESIFAEASVWLELLRLEVLPPEGAAREAALQAVLEYAESRGLVQTDAEGRLHVAEKGADWVALLAAQVRPLLEAYRALIDAVLELGGAAERRRIEEEAGALHQRHLLLGEAAFPEGISEMTVRNALRWLVQERFLVGDADLRRPSARLRHGPRWEELVPLSDRLASALRSE